MGAYSRDCRRSIDPGASAPGGCWLAPDMALLVDAQDQAMLRPACRARHVATVSTNSGSVESLTFARCGAGRRSPDAMMGSRRAWIDGFGHRPQAPVRGVFWRRLQGHRDRSRPISSSPISRGARTGPRQSQSRRFSAKSPAPFAEGVIDSARAFGDRLVFQRPPHARRFCSALRRPCGAPRRDNSLKLAEAHSRPQLINAASSAHRRLHPNTGSKNHRMNDSIGDTSSCCDTRNRIMISPLDWRHDLRANACVLSRGKTVSTFSG